MPNYNPNNKYVRNEAAATVAMPKVRPASTKAAPAQSSETVADRIANLRAATTQVAEGKQTPQAGAAARETVAIPKKEKKQKHSYFAPTEPGSIPGEIRFLLAILAFGAMLFSAYLTNMKVSYPTLPYLGYVLAAGLSVAELIVGFVPNMPWWLRAIIVAACTVDTLLSLSVLRDGSGGELLDVQSWRWWVDLILALMLGPVPEAIYEIARSGKVGKK